MGAFEEGQAIDPLVQSHYHRSKPSATVMILLGLLAPMVMSFYGSDVMLQSLFWMYSSHSGGISGFTLMPMNTMMLTFPLMFLRLIPASQIYRYYTGKTTRKRALLAILAGDGIFLFVGLVSFIFIPSSYGMFFVPLPFQILVGLILLWRFPIPIATTPWEVKQEPKSWWEKTSSTESKPEESDDDKLW